MQQLVHRSATASYGLREDITAISTIARSRRKKPSLKLLQAMLLLLVLTCCCFWAEQHAAGMHNATVAGPIGARFKAQTKSSYGVADGYWHLTVNYTFPTVSVLSRTRFLMTNISCWDLAKSHSEPYSQDYQVTHRKAPSGLPGGVPRAIWKWQGKISRHLFDTVPFLLRESEVAGGCTHCTFVLRYKVIDGQLYTDRKRRHRALDGQEEEVDILEELLLATLHVYQVPDVDFLLHLGDGSPAGLPLVQVNINRSHEQAGFTLPKYMWRDALGPQQFAMLAECLQARYPVLPHQQRIQRAVWRGSNTDSKVLLMDEKNVMQVMRTRLHMYGLWYPNIMDAHYTAFAQQAFDTNCIEELIPTGPQLQLEEFNKYGLVLDIDGNGWSDRFRLLSHFNTPVLKQASNLTAFFEHVIAPGAIVEHYAHDLADLPVRVQELLRELARSPARLIRMAEQQQGLAHYLLNQLAVLHAAAYTLGKVAELSSWRPVPEDTYELVPFSKCCNLAHQLPQGFVRAVRARGRHRE